MGQLWQFCPTIEESLKNALINTMLFIECLLRLANVRGMGRAYL
jgi:hypothetical protein